MSFLCAVIALGTLQAQTASVSIPAWVETSVCDAPKFEATLNGNPVPVTSQFGPKSDQLVLIVLDLTGDLSLLEEAKPALIAAISKLPRNAWIGLLRDQDSLHVLADPSAARQPVVEAIIELAETCARDPWSLAPEPPEKELI